MISSREAIMTALFTLLQGARFSRAVNGNTTWVTSSRRMKLWTDVAKSQRPALFLAEHGETPAYNENVSLPARVVGMPIRRAPTRFSAVARRALP